MAPNANGPGQAEQGGENEVPERFARDEFYRALAATPRRRVLYYLLEEGGCAVEDLATVLTGWEATEKTTMATGDDRRHSLATLTHQHLPMLAEADLLTYDRERERVEPASLESHVAEVIRWSIAAETEGRAP